MLGDYFVVVIVGGVVSLAITCIWAYGLSYFITRGFYAGKRKGKGW